MNAGELPEMDPYEDVAQYRQAPPLSPAYVPNLIELDEHVPVYIPKPEHPEFDGKGFIDYPDEPEDDDEDPKEDPEEDHTDYPADGGDGDDEPSDDDTDDEDEEPTEDEDDDKEEEHLAPADSFVRNWIAPEVLRDKDLNEKLSHLEGVTKAEKDVIGKTMRISAAIQVADLLLAEGITFVVPLIPTFIAGEGSLIVSGSRTPTVSGQVTNSVFVCALYSARASGVKLALVAQWKGSSILLPFTRPNDEVHRHTSGPHQIPQETFFRTSVPTLGSVVYSSQHQCFNL
nr:hypothetical protein [Tanacetum cinerariifolium]